MTETAKNSLAAGRRPSPLGWRVAPMAATALFVLTLGAAATGSGQPQIKSYTEADMPGLMAATWNEDVLGGGLEAEAVKSLLQRGQLIFIKELAQGKWLIGGGVLANASPETIFKGYTDHPHYDQIMPETEKATAVPLGPNIVDLTIDHRIKIMTGVEVPASYTITVYYRPPLRADWVKSAGDFEENTGYLQLIPVDGGKQTMIFFTCYSLPRIPIVTSLIEKDPNLDLVINMSVAIVTTRALKKYGEAAEKREPFVPAKDQGDLVELMAKTPDTINLLINRGGMLLIEEGPTIWATTAVSMAISPPEAFQTATSFENFPCFQPEMKKVKIKQRTATTAKVDFEMDINYAVLSVGLAFSYDYLFNAPNNMTWKWVEGDVPSQQGNWTFIEQDGGKKTLAIFRNTLDLKTLPGLGGFGVKSAINIEPTLEPAILASQALITAKGIRDAANMPKAKRDEILQSCPRK